MKQKIVIKVQMTCDKCRSKAMQLVAAAGGVNSVAITGEDRNQLVVVGDGVDSICLTSTLRKKVGHAQIVEVGEVKKDEKSETKKDEPATLVAYPQRWYPQPVVVYEYPPSSGYSNPDPCSIM